MFAALLSALTDSIVKGIFSLISAEMEKRGLIQQGMALQAAAESAKTASTQAAMAQAVADAPKTKDAALKRLEGGSA